MSPQCSTKRSTAGGRLLVLSAISVMTEISVYSRRSVKRRQANSEWRTANGKEGPEAPYPIRHSRIRYWLSSVGNAHAAPGVPHLLVMHHGIVDRRGQAQRLRPEAADGEQQRIRGHHAVALCRHQGDPRVHQRLLRIEHVERGALADPRLLAHAVERHFARRDLF